tara:strand:+ start:303 stop:686 length:384 start_codon:yes stop_codon:yes gene_type:complete
MLDVKTANYIKDVDGSNCAVNVTLNDDKRTLSIPIDEGNSHYIELKKWIDAGNTIQPAYTPPTPTLDQQWASVRADRDSRLAETDWTQTPDVPQETIWKWKTYRQDLRDIPQKQTDPNNITWPTKPS